MPAPNVEIRSATPDDIDGIIDVCSQALGWSDPEFDEALFRWKHLDNAFGQSAMLVAVERDEILAVRPFMRWKFASTNQSVTAVRAVDTATRPDAQGRGLFRSLTEAGLEQLRAEDVGFVFNTPNAKSLAGYLKMGWEEAGQVRLGYAMRSPLSAFPMMRSRTAATKRSIPTPTLGQSIGDALATIKPEHLAASDDTLRTAHTLDTLLWRYDAGPIDYRFVPGPNHTGAVVRLRQRGASKELVVAELVGKPTSQDKRAIIGHALRETRADYYLAPVGTPRTVAIDRLGPTLAMRKINQQPDSASMSWQPGDIEVF